MPATYESCSTRFFHRGRTETIRSCTSGGSQHCAGITGEAPMLVVVSHQAVCPTRLCVPSLTPFVCSSPVLV
ncbi:unnamed protein product [Discosporangium mesarthrocarpum]